MTERAPQFGWLLAAAFLTILLWRVPYGSYAVYPFTILATWFHEMGHGLTAWALGGQFDRLLLYPDGSGAALHHAGIEWGRLRRALVAAGGPMGPAIAGSLFVVSTRWQRSAPAVLTLLALGIAASIVLWVRTSFGIAALGGLASLMFIAALRLPAAMQVFLVQFLGVQACISCYRQIGYLLTRTVVIDGNVMLSDTGQIARQLLLPYWFWGALTAAGSLYLVYCSLSFAYAGSETQPAGARSPGND